MKQSKKLLSIILAFVMMLSAIPFAFAEGTIEAKIGETEYPTLKAANSAAKAGDTITLCSDVCTNGILSLKGGITLDGAGNKIYGHSVLYVDGGNITIKNVNFEGIHGTNSVGASDYYHWSSKTGSATAIVSEGPKKGSTYLTVTDCKFDRIDWESMQLLNLPDGYNLTITNNEFRNSGIYDFISEGDATGVALRYIHLQNKIGNINLNISGNKFYDHTLDCAISVTDVAPEAEVVAEKNYVDHARLDVYIDYSDGSTEDIGETFLPLLATPDAEEADYYPEIVYVDYNDLYANGYRFAPSLQDLLTKEDSNYGIVLNKDVTIDATEVKGNVVIDLNEKTLDVNFAEIPESTNLTIAGNGSVTSDPTDHLGENCEVEKNGDTWTTSTIYAAEIVETGVKYETLGAALYNAGMNNLTVKLLRDVKLDGCLEIQSDKSVTLDLNGFTVAYYGANQSVIYNDGKLTIQDNSETKTGKFITNYDYFGFIVFNDGGNLTIDGGTYCSIEEADYFCPIYSSSGDVTINGGEIQTNYMPYFLGGTNLTVNGGKIIGATYPIYANQAGNIIVNGGELTGTKYGIYTSKINSLTINGGEITGNSYGVYANTAGSIIVNDGTFTGTNGIALRGVNTPITVNGGKFACSSDSYEIYADENKLNITGGIYTTEYVSNVTLTDDYIVRNNEDETTNEVYPFTVGHAPVLVTYVADGETVSEYGSGLKSVIAYIEDYLTDCTDITVSLREDNNEDVTIPVGVTIDSNGFAYTGTMTAPAGYDVVENNGVYTTTTHIHAYVETVADEYLVSAATCTDKAVYYKSCRCGDTTDETFETEALGHNYQWVIDNEPTCTESGKKHEECTRCGDKLDAVVSNPLGHSWDEGTVTSGQYDKETVTEYTCTICGEKKVVKENNPNYQFRCKKCDWFDEVNVPSTNPFLLFIYKIVHAFTHLIQQINHLS